MDYVVAVTDSKGTLVTQPPIVSAAVGFSVAFDVITPAAVLAVVARLTTSFWFQ